MHKSMVMEPIEVSMYFEQSKSKTMNLNKLAEALKRNGWKDGKAYAIVHEDGTFTVTNSLIKSAPLLMEMRAATSKKKNAEREIWTGPVLRPSLSPFEGECPPRKELMMVAGDRKKAVKAYL